MKKILLIIVLCIILVIMTSMNIPVREGLPPMFKSMSDSGQISDLDGLRTVLEMLYAVTYVNPNGLTSDSIPNTLCYRCYVLGSVIPSLLGGLASQDMQTLWSIYGQRAIPTGMKAMPPTKIPILSSSKDYAMFMKLCNAGKSLATFNNIKSPIWTQMEPPGTTTPPGATSPPKPPIYDKCNNVDEESKRIVSQASVIYKDAVDALAYFHNQLDTSIIIYPGDTKDTSLYQPNP